MLARFNGVISSFHRVKKQPRYLEYSLLETKVLSQEALRSKGTEQVDFREEALKTKVRTKTLGQDELKSKHAEQKDFRGETIKSKVVTKAYREEAIKVRMW